MDGHCALPCTSKHYNALNLDLAKNCQKKFGIYGDCFIREYLGSIYTYIMKFCVFVTTH